MSAISKIFPKPENIKIKNALGKERVYVIFFTGRCGSTLLTNLVKDFSGFGIPEEFLNEDFVRHFLSGRSGDISFGKYLELLSANVRDDIFGFEVDPMRFSWYLECGLLSAADIISSDNGIIWMTRDDLVLQSYSYASARKSGYWHNTEGSDLSCKKELNEKITDEDIWVELVSILYSEWWMEKIFLRYNVNPLRISYERLVADRMTTLVSVLAEASGEIVNLQMPKELKAGVSPVNYKNRSMWCAEFYSRNNTIMKDIYQARRGGG